MSRGLAEPLGAGGAGIGMRESLLKVCMGHFGVASCSRSWRWVWVAQVCTVTEAQSSHLTRGRAGGPRHEERRQGRSGTGLGGH